jgi:hypothetical protein
LTVHGEPVAVHVDPLQNCAAEHTLTLALVRGAQHPETQSVFLRHSFAQVAAPPFAVTHLDGSPPAVQQSVSVVHAAPAATHVLAQNPRGAQTMAVVPCTGEQHPDAHELPEVHFVAHTSG